MNKQIEITQELITPELAKFLLSRNPTNRRVNQMTVRRYADDMQNNRWKSGTAETIKIGISGNVLDGQHRLLAIIKSNTPVFASVARNVDDSVFDVLDTGKQRTAQDSFKVCGIKNDTNVPAIISVFMRLKLNNYLTSKGKTPGVTTQVLINEYYKDEDYWQSVFRKSQVWYNSFAKILPISSIGGFYAFFNEIYEKLSFQFMDQLTTGNNISNNALSLLRTRLMQDKLALRKISQEHKYALIIKSWNYFVTGKEPRILKYDPKTEQFPTAVGSNRLLKKQL